MNIPVEILNEAKSWIYVEAKKVIKRIDGKTPEKGYVLFETGYGPSGLPHIGTFGEVCRTTMVMKAFEQLTDGKIPTKLICFSDDMDGFRKVPENVPNRDELTKYLNKPLTKVIDPFGCCDSFGQHNNKLLCKFLDDFNFEYEFVSSTEYYTSGKFDDALIKLLNNYEKVQNIMLPTLGEERASTYSPFLPICPETEKVLQVPVTKIDTTNNTITYRRDDGVEIETKITGGACKLQWKPDWALRWYALDVDYEMCGKDLKPSIDVSGKIVRVLGGKPPENIVYELFLDEQGSKISKSKGNGISIEDWLKYAPQESLSLFMYHKPKTAKKLYFDVIPKNMDEYLTWVEKYNSQDDSQKVENPVHHIHGGNVPNNSSPISFSLLLNLASVVNSSDTNVLWGFISKYAPKATPEKSPKLAQMVEYAICYYQDFVKPKKQYRHISDVERPQFELLKNTLKQMINCKDSSELQTAVFSVGKEFNYEKLGDWFSAIYQVLLGQKQGPRIGSFILLYGVQEMIDLIDKALNNEID